MPAIAAGFSRLVGQLKQGFQGFLPIFLLVAYTVIGALIFRELEAPNEQYTLETLQKERAELLENTVFRLNNVRAMQPVAAYNHTRKTLLRYQDRLGVDEVNIESQMKWTFWGSVFYCITVYTTIGYGNIAPITTGGRIITILYAFAGIPLALISLYSLGLLFARLCKFIWHGIIKSTSVVSKDLEKKMTDAVGIEDESAPNTKEASGNGGETDDLLSFPIWFLIFVTFLWILLSALIFCLLEDWDYGTSLYFTLISFTTIGFGDIVPSEYSYALIVGMALLVGLALVSSVLTIIQDQISALGEDMQANIDREYMNALAEAADEGEISEQEARRMSVKEPNTVNLEDGEQPVEEVKEKDKKSMEAVIARMPLKERMLYYVMPASSKKALEKSAETKTGRRNKACQTDSALLESLIKEEILKMELNNELERIRPPGQEPDSPFLTQTPATTAFLMHPSTSREPEPSTSTAPEYYQPKLVSRGFKIEKVTPIETVSNEEETPIITTKVIQEEDV